MLQIQQRCKSPRPADWRNPACKVNRSVSFAFGRALRRSRWWQVLSKKLQDVFWVYCTKNFIITNTEDFTLIEPAIRCDLLSVTSGNYFRVQEFREQDRIREYRTKLERNEIGFFAEYDGKIVGSIWATINQSPAPNVVRRYMKLMPGEALIHDIVTGERYRGMGVGPFMVCQIAPVLLGEYKASRIVIDVNVRNTASLKMMNKAGLQVKQTALYVSAFKKLVFHRVVKSYQ